MDEDVRKKVSAKPAPISVDDLEQFSSSSPGIRSLPPTLSEVCIYNKCIRVEDCGLRYHTIDARGMSATEIKRRIFEKFNITGWDSPEAFDVLLDTYCLCNSTKYSYLSPEISPYHVLSDDELVEICSNAEFRNTMCSIKLVRKDSLNSKIQKSGKGLSYFFRVFRPYLYSPGTSSSPTVQVGTANSGLKSLFSSGQRRGLSRTVTSSTRSELHTGGIGDKSSETVSSGFEPLRRCISVGNSNLDQKHKIGYMRQGITQKPKVAEQLKQESPEVSNMKEPLTIEGERPPSTLICEKITEFFPDLVFSRIAQLNATRSKIPSYNENLCKTPYISSCEASLQETENRHKIESKADDKQLIEYLKLRLKECQRNSKTYLTKRTSFGRRALNDINSKSVPEEESLMVVGDTKVLDLDRKTTRPFEHIDPKEKIKVYKIISKNDRKDSLEKTYVINQKSSKLPSPETPALSVLTDKCEDLDYPGGKHSKHNGINNYYWNSLSETPDHGFISPSDNSYLKNQSDPNTPRHESLTDARNLSDAPNIDFCLEEETLCLLDNDVSKSEQRLEPHQNNSITPLSLENESNNSFNQNDNSEFGDCPETIALRMPPRFNEENNREYNSFRAIKSDKSLSAWSSLKGYSFNRIRTPGSNPQRHRSDEIHEEVSEDLDDSIFKQNNETDTQHFQAQQDLRMSVFCKKYQCSEKIEWVKGPLIGKGSFGKVFYAVNTSTYEIMAVKQMKIELRNKGFTEKIVRALKSEIALMREISHENVVQYLGFELNNEIISIYLEYVSGGTVNTMLSALGPFSQCLVRSITCQVLSGLEYLHERRIIHRDIKSANILLNEYGVAKISDFGVSKKLAICSPYKTCHRMSLQGSVRWMAPEVIKSKGYSAKVDIWSLGCVVIEMITGSVPWKELGQMQIVWRLGKNFSPQVPENASKLARNFIMLTLAISPKERPKASELLKHPFADVDPSRFDYITYKRKIIAGKGLS